LNKFTIPSILLATIMVAGAFSFVPVEQASTIHTSGVFTSASFAAGAVDSDAIATDAVTTTEIDDGTIVDADVSADALSGAVLDDDLTADTLTSESADTDLALAGAGTGDVVVNDDLTATGDLNAAGGFKVLIPFSFSNFGAGATTEDLFLGIDIGASNDLVFDKMKMPYAGSVIGATVMPNGMQAGDTITCEVNNITDPATFALTAGATSDAQVTTTQAKDITTFAANDQLQVECTGANLEGGEDVAVWIIVEY